MSLLKIARLGHPNIRSGADPVSAEQLKLPALQDVIDDMIETMRDAHGVGIAAPQVHVCQRIIAIEVSPENPRYPNQAEVPLTVLINPEIIEHGEALEDGWEGCLSVPDLRGLVPRWAYVKVRGVNRDGKDVQFEASGFHARVVQHEVDHLMGQVFLDRMPNLQSLTHLGEYEQYWK
jgi:peptide deformylase